MAKSCRQICNVQRTIFAAYDQTLFGSGCIELFPEINITSEEYPVQVHSAKTSADDIVYHLMTDEGKKVCDFCENLGHMWLNLRLTCKDIYDFCIATRKVGTQPVMSKEKLGMNCRENKMLLFKIQWERINTPSSSTLHREALSFVCKWS